MGGGGLCLKGQKQVQESGEEQNGVKLLLESVDEGY